MPATYPYNGYQLVVRDPAMPTDVPVVAVYDPRFKKDPALYRTSSLDLATRWVDAYRAGQIWAAQEALPR